jgi:hypothetical protein
MNNLKWFIEFISQDNNHFIGFLIISSGIGTGLFLLIRKIFHHRQIMKHGYPPKHYLDSIQQEEEDDDY